MYALIASIAIALISLIGVFLFRRKQYIRGTHRFLLPLSVGVLLAVVFFELLPETFHEAEHSGSIAVVVGFLGFYLLSHWLRTYHHHHTNECVDCVSPSSAKLVLAGDAVHNFSDGIVIAGAFLIDPAVGIATTIGIALHEIPQEIAEFSILVASGLSKMRAALLNLYSASSVVLGTIVTYFIAEYVEHAHGIILGVAAGNLLYIAATDLLPELDHEHKEKGHFWQVFISMLAGLVVMVFVLSFGHGHE